MLQVPVLFLEFIIIKSHRHELLFRQSLSLLSIAAVNLILFNPLLKFLGSRLEDPVMLMNLVGFFDVSLAFDLEFFNKLLNLILTFFNSLFEGDFGLITLVSFGLESLHFSAHLNFAIFNIQSKSLNISHVLFLEKFILLSQVIDPLLHLSFHLIFVGDLTVFEFDISLVFFILPYRQLKRFPLLLKDSAQLLQLLGLIVFLFGTYLKLLLHDIVALFELNRYFPIFINLFLHALNFLAQLI